MLPQLPPRGCTGTGQRRTVRRTWPRRHSSGIRSETEGAILACRTRAAAILAVHVGPCCAGPRHHRRDCPQHDRARRRLADARRPARTPSCSKASVSGRLIFLRLATLFLCIWLLLYSLDKLDANMKEIEQELHLGEFRREVEFGLHPADFGVGAPNKARLLFRLRSADSLSDQKSRFWRK